MTLRSLIIQAAARQLSHWCNRRMRDLTRAELATVFGVSERTLQRALGRGLPGVRSYRIGRTTFFRPDAIEAIKEALACPTPPASGARFVARTARSASVARPWSSPPPTRDAVVALTPAPRPRVRDADARTT